MLERKGFCLLKKASLFNLFAWLEKMNLHVTENEGYPLEDTVLTTNRHKGRGETRYRSRANAERRWGMTPGS